MNVNQIKAQALRDAAADLMNRNDSEEDNWHEGYVSAVLRLQDIADEMETE